jgi:hypothetical protein
MKRVIWIILLIGLAIVVAPTMWAQISPSTAPVTCNIAGAWVGNSPPLPGIYTRTVYATFTMTPTDPTGKQLVGVVQPVNPPSSPADFQPDGIGIYVRAGPRNYQFTWPAYQVKADSPERSEIVGFWAFSGTAECTDENTLILTGMVSFYDASFDSNGDGFPDPGAVPYLHAPWGWTLHRLPLMAP